MNIPPLPNHNVSEVVKGIESPLRYLAWGIWTSVLIAAIAAWSDIGATWKTTLFMTALLSSCIERVVVTLLIKHHARALVGTVDYWKRQLQLDQELDQVKKLVESPTAFQDVARKMAKEIIREEMQKAANLARPQTTETVDVETTTESLAPMPGSTRVGNLPRKEGTGLCNTHSRIGRALRRQYARK